MRVPIRALPLLVLSPANAKLDSLTLDLGGRLRPGVTSQRALHECFAIWTATIYRRRP